MNHGTPIDGLNHGTPIGLNHGTPIGVNHGTPIGVNHGTPIGVNHGTPIHHSNTVTHTVGYPSAPVHDHSNAGLGHLIKDALFGCDRSSSVGVPVSAVSHSVGYTPASAHHTYVTPAQPVHVSRPVGICPPASSQGGVPVTAYVSPAGVTFEGHHPTGSVITDANGVPVAGSGVPPAINRFY